MSALKPAPPLALIDARIATSAEWDCIYSACDYATFFHSRQWADAWFRSSKGAIEPVPRILTFSDGATALLPLCRRRLRRNLPVSQYLSSPAGTYGGWVSASELTTAHCERLVEHMRRRVPNLAFRINPYDPLAANVRFGKVRDDETRVLSLDDSISEITRRFSKGHKAAIRSADQQGVTVRRAAGLEDWKMYYSAYEDSLRRWGDQATSRYPWSLFEELYEFDAASVRLWVADLSGDLLSGALCFYARSHVVWWHGATFENAFPLRPVHLLIYEALRDASQRKFKWFDFNPSGGHVGVSSFKKHFGTETLPAPMIFHTNRKQRAALKLIKVSAKIGRVAIRAR